MDDHTYIAVVDGDPLVAKALERLLRNEGYAVHCYQTAEEVLKAARTEHYSVLICDQSLKPTTSMELMQAFQNESPSTVKILLVAQMASVPTLIRKSQGLRFQVAIKPWSNMQMLQTVQAAMTRYREQVSQ